MDTSGELLREGVKEKPYMIKPIRESWNFWRGCRLPDQEAVEEEAKRLAEQGRLQGGGVHGKQGNSLCGSGTDHFLNRQRM